MSRFNVNKKLAGLVLVLLPLGLLFFYVALNSGPLARVDVTTEKVRSGTIKPAIYGLGSVVSRYSHQIGPRSTGRLQSVFVDVGDQVVKGQLLAQLEAVDLVSLQAAAESSVSAAAAQVELAKANLRHAEAQLLRYENLLNSQAVSEDLVSSKRQAAEVSRAAVTAASEQHRQAISELAAVTERYQDLKLTAPEDGLVTSRFADVGTIVVAGQAVMTLVDDAQLWVNVRFDQVNASGLSTGLMAEIKLRSAADTSYLGRVYRVEPVADVVTEEMLAKVIFDPMPRQMPPIGELAEVTLYLPELTVNKIIPNAAIHEQQGQYGVWQEDNGKTVFTPIEIGARDLDGQVEVISGLSSGARIIVYSKEKLTAQQRVKVVERLTSEEA